MCDYCLAEPDVDVEGVPEPIESESDERISIGRPKRGEIWKHRKGNTYFIIGVGTHSETLEELVVYEGDGKTWIRPLSMFCDGRFQRVSG